MYKDSLPDTKLEFMHQIDDKHEIHVETERFESFGEGVLEPER